MQDLIMREKKCEPGGEIPTAPLYLIREAEDLEGGFDSRLGGEDGAEVGRPAAKEDEPIVVSVHDKRTVSSKVSEPLNAPVGMKDAIGEGELGAGGMDEIKEWNGERSDGRVLLELEGAGEPALLFSADGSLAIVWDV